jgi:hypothetical protein
MPFLLCRREGQSPDALSFCNKTKFNMAGDTGLEPVHVGIKIRCLTNLANLHQNMVVGRYANFCFHKDVFTDFAL